MDGQPGSLALLPKGRDRAVQAYGNTVTRQEQSCCPTTTGPSGHGPGCLRRKEKNPLNLAEGTASGRGEGCCPSPLW